MKKFIIIAVFSIVVIIVIAFLLMNTKMFHLHYARYFNENDVGIVEVGGALDLKGLMTNEPYAARRSITDKKIIKKILDYLNNLSLVPVKKPNIQENASINIYGWLDFKDKDGNDLAGISFLDGGYIISAIYKKDGSYDARSYKQLFGAVFDLEDLK